MANGVLEDPDPFRELDELAMRALEGSTRVLRYELYVEDLREADGVAEMYGVVNVPNVYLAVYIWRSGEWVKIDWPEDASMIFDLIIEKRESRSW